MGLREIKKQQTRALIADTAWRLFAERGFERVAVAEVARQSQVSEATVFNYFPTKEDLFYARFKAFGDHLVEAVATRPPGTSVLAAFSDHLLAPSPLLDRVEAGDPEATEHLRTVNRVIAESPLLQIREQRIAAAATAALAAALAAETNEATPDIRANVVATALMGVHSALVQHVRQRILADGPPGPLASEVHTLGTQAFELLSRGLKTDLAPMSRTRG